MKARLRKSGIVIDVVPYALMPNCNDAYIEVNSHGIWYASDLDFTLSEPEEEVRIYGYVARNKDGDIHIFNNKPYRDGVSNGGDFWFSPNGGSHFELPEDAFSHITWLSEPQEVTITIKPKKK